jgi:hypothetical protein
MNSDGDKKLKYNFDVEILENDHLEIWRDGRIILKQTFCAEYVRIWTGLNWHTIMSNNELWYHQY